MVITSLADGVMSGVESVTSGLSAALFDRPIRLGVTGLARSGKTVFITSLVANLMDRGRMLQLSAAREGRIEAAFLQPQPDDTVPRFDYENHLAALTGPSPHWPDSTRAVSELRLSLKVRPAGLLAGLQGPRTLHLDIVDYPGEWLLDLALLDKTYAEWSADVLVPHCQPPAGGPLPGRDNPRPFPPGTHDEPQAQALAAAFTDYLAAARAAGFYDCTPGRFLLPGDLEGSPVLTFAPLCRKTAARRAAASGARWNGATRPINPRSSSPSSATTSPASTGRWCWLMRSRRSTPARRRLRICAMQ